MVIRIHMSEQGEIIEYNEARACEACAALVAFSGRIAVAHAGAKATAADQAAPRRTAEPWNSALHKLGVGHVCTHYHACRPVTQVSALDIVVQILERIWSGLCARRARHRLTLGIHPRHDVVLATVAVVVDSVGAERHRVLDGEAGAGAPAVGVTAIGVSVTVVVDVVVAVISFVAEGDAWTAVARRTVRGTEGRGVLTRAAVDDHVGAFTAAGESEDGGEKTGPKEGRAVHAGHDASFRSLGSTDLALAKGGQHRVDCS